MRPQCGKVDELCSNATSLFGDGFCLCRKHDPPTSTIPHKRTWKSQSIIPCNLSSPLSSSTDHILDLTSKPLLPYLQLYAELCTRTSKIKMREVISINGKEPSTRRTPLISRVLNHITTFCTNASAPHSRPGRLPNCKLLLGGELQHNTMRPCRFVAPLLMAGVTNLRGFHYSSTALSTVSRYVSSRPQCCRHRPRTKILY